MNPPQPFGNSYATAGGYGELPDGTDPSNNDIDYERHYDTPDSFIQKQGQVGDNMMDMDLTMQERRHFTRDDFRLMINKTFTEYYGKFRDQFNPDEYMQCVDSEDLVKRFNAFLEYSPDNILTRDLIPWFDLGDIPTTHSFMRPEAA